MEFSIPRHIADLSQEIRGFIDAQVIPLEADLATRPFLEIERALDRVRADARRRGLWLPQLSEKHGGMNLGVLGFALISEQLGRSPLGHYALNCQVPDAGNMEILIEHGTPEQQERWLRPLLAGEIRSCFSLTEPEHPGSNPLWLDTTASPRDGGWVLNGRKWFSTGADGAAFALVVAITDPAAEPHARQSVFIVPTSAPGYRLVRNLSIMGQTGSGWASHAEIVYEDCRLPAESLLGSRGAGALITQSRLGTGRIHHCMRWIGVAERAFSMMCERAARRELAPGDPLGGRQIVQTWIAESRAEIDAARLLVLHSAWKLETRGIHEARTDVSLVKFHVADVMAKVLDRALQVHGALGMTDDTILSFFYRQERGARIYDGPDEIHKTLVARRILAGAGLRKDERR
ncbi:acyl-CoA dehydrogenase family protein [Sorangium cellulosum]|uniref:Acyl-CoA dehydrogenase n=1 Tax=Sorangium cellulosum TaxID=56 RepID=A0A150QKR8_SORCE|nr:acyl-CoA dehydrogenase family protein [Sorangium cellulosum]KYF68581.1 acyl-CoA dehydrogenase [Sorangium cellulosum]